MATVTPSTIQPNDVWGETEQRWISLTPATSDYVAGGYTLTPGQGISLGTIYSVIPFANQGGISPVWNTTTKKLQMFAVGSSANTPLGLGTLSTTSTKIGVVSNVITVTIANSLVAGNFVYLQSFTAGGALNGLIVQVLTASSTQFTAAYPTPNITAATADVTGTYQLVQAGTGNLLTTGTSATITNSLATTSLITMTCSNSFSVGEFVIIQGLTNGAAANGVIVQILTASSTQFTATWTGTAFSSASDSGTASLLVTNGSAPVTTAGFASSITNSLATASSAGTAGVITLTANQSFVPGNIVVVNNLTNGAAVNGDILTVLSTSLTHLLFKANGKTAAITTGSDSGTAELLVTGIPTTSPAENEVQTGTDLSGYTFQLLVFGK